MNRGKQRSAAIPRAAGDVLDQRDSAWEDLLVCPTCGTGLKAAGDNLRCETCPNEWPVVDDVPTFLQQFPYWGEIPQAPMLKVNELVREKYWKDVLLESDDPSVQARAEMIMDTDRANRHLLT